MVLQIINGCIPAHRGYIPDNRVSIIVPVAYNTTPVSYNVAPVAYDTTPVDYNVALCLIIHHMLAIM